MPKVPGQPWSSMADQIREGTCELSILKRLQMSLSLAECIDRLETCGCSHRDLSCGNVFVSQNSCVYLIDWDCLYNKQLPFQANTTAGTMGYMPSFIKKSSGKEHFGDIICANEPEASNGTAPFYTNSTHLPVNYTADIFKVLDLQDDLQTRYTGGTVLHIFLGEAAPDPQAVKTFIRKVCQNYHLPYFTISPTFSVCPEHGYITGEHHKCPKCGSETEVYSRVVGYLRPVDQWNEGKQAEFNLRSLYKIKG